MTPNPNLPIVIKHEVPEYACDNSKRLSLYFSKLRGDILKNRWDGISEKDITLMYNNSDGVTEVEIVYRDNNNHVHQFIIQFVPDTGFGNTDDGSFSLIYLFKGKFEENAVGIRSFVKYLSIHLQYECFEPKMINNDNGLSMPCSIEYAYNDLCQLIDITLSKIKPLVWFYSKEPVIKTLDEAYYYMAGVQARVQMECCKGRWRNVKPACIKLVRYEAEQELSLGLVYVVEDVWEHYITINVAQCQDYFDLFCTFTSYANLNLPNEIKRELNILFVDFLSSLKIVKGNTFIGFGERRDHSISIQYFHIEDTFEIYCKMLDEIVTALQSFNFQLPLQPINLTKRIEALKEQMEETLNTTLEVVPEEEQINKKLQCGYFKT